MQLRNASKIISSGELSGTVAGTPGAFPVCYPTSANSSSKFASTMPPWCRFWLGIFPRHG
jgi:hypothetical protein